MVVGGSVVVVVVVDVVVVVGATVVVVVLVVDVVVDVVVVGAVVVGELLFGFRHGARFPANLADLESFLDSPYVELLPVSLVTADRFGRIMMPVGAVLSCLANWGFSLVPHLGGAVGRLVGATSTVALVFGLMAVAWGINGFVSVLAVLAALMRLSASRGAAAVRDPAPPRRGEKSSRSVADARAGFGVVLGSPYLRSIAAIMLLSGMVAQVIDLPAPLAALPGSVDGLAGVEEVALGHGHGCARIVEGGKGRG